MIVPMLESEYQNKSLEELIKIRKKLMREITKFENEYIFGKKKPSKDLDVIQDPGEDVVYITNNMNLVMITKLIKEKQQIKDLLWFFFEIKNKKRSKKGQKNRQKSQKKLSGRSKKGQKKVKNAKNSRLVC